MYNIYNPLTSNFIELPGEEGAFITNKEVSDKIKSCIDAGELSHAYALDHLRSFNSRRVSAATELIKSAYVKSLLDDLNRAKSRFIENSSPGNKDHLEVAIKNLEEFCQFGAKNV